MIANTIVSLLAVAAFAFVLWRGRIVPLARDALKVSLTGLGAMTSKELDDAAKEEAVRRAGFGLILTALGFFWCFGLALAAAALPILFADAVGLVSSDAVFQLMMRWDYLIIVSVILIVLAKGVRRRHSSRDEAISGMNGYSATDRFVHMLAFSSPAVLTAASVIEDRLLPRAAQQPTAPPIFVMSLARGGTTALLNALHDIPGIATHTYRDMPFLTAPSLWNRLAGGQKRAVERRQRAHGDGLEIDLDSPEALEEVIWKMFWPDKYQRDAITMWCAEDHKTDPERFLTRHMAKVIGARLSREAGDSSTGTIYCSKNNANIARILFLTEAFPNCRIIVPVRRPECHAASLLRQHQNFSKRQAEDEFVCRYMRDIGHFEFGLIHRPIQFPGFDAARHDPFTADYWLHYWVQAFQEILKHRDRCIFVLQDDLRTSPQEVMTNLCATLDIMPGSLQFADYFLSSPDQSPTHFYNQELYKKAVELYREFERIALSTRDRINSQGPS